MRRILLLAATLVLAAAAPMDLPGWDRSRWGMTTKQLEAAFGPELTRLKATLDFGKVYVTHSLDQVSIAGQVFTARFQMGRGDDRLHQVLLERRQSQVTPIGLAKVERAFRDLYGPPTRACDNGRRRSTPALRQLMWEFPTTTVHLSFMDFMGVVLFEKPSLDIDPLQPSFERRLYSRRLMPRRLLVRYHPTARRDLARMRCAVEVKGQRSE